MIAEALIKIDASGDFWSESARSLILALVIAHGIDEPHLPWSFGNDPLSEIPPEFGDGEKPAGAP